MSVRWASFRFFQQASLLVPVFFFLTGCDSLWRKEIEKTPLARVGEKYLYWEDVETYVGDNLSPEDSASFVNNLINKWAKRELLLARSQINLPDFRIREFESLISDYRSELYTRAYKEFYENEKENFRLQEKIIQLRFIELPVLFLNKEEVTDRLRRFDSSDLNFLDSVGVQFRKLHFNDSIWIPVSRVIEEINPLTYENEAEYLKISQFFEMEDSTGVYLTKVVDILNINDIAPRSYIEPTIRQVLLNRRKIDYLKSLETDLINEAIGQKEFEIYEKQD